MILNSNAAHTPAPTPLHSASTSGRLTPTLHSFLHSTFATLTSRSRSGRSIPSLLCSSPFRPKSHSLIEVLPPGQRTSTEAGYLARMKWHIAQASIGGSRPTVKGQRNTRQIPLNKVAKPSPTKAVMQESFRSFAA
ncbi:hypothetical protein [Synechococcus sp. PCC 6312]|uniref:hypothetical protein n=1 Tax=Synechococcus sp. (strain ATCC 27167 / PCC 6312) TaxID=195253 RepID=UPI0012EADF9C|nr:hypothetical protein [Synechococcus sp. PCC 6312]